MIKHQGGFTLIELIVTIAIIGIIAAVAWPEYERYQTRNRRVDGINALMSASQELQQCHTDKGGYIDNGGNNCTFSTTSKKGYYTIAAITPLAIDTFTLSAIPQGAQADDGECATLTINQLGQKGFTTTTTPAGTLNRCWSQ